MSRLFTSYHAYYVCSRDDWRQQSISDITLVALSMISSLQLSKVGYWSSLLQQTALLARSARATTFTTADYVTAGVYTIPCPKRSSSRKPQYERSIAAVVHADLRGIVLDFTFTFKIAAATLSDPVH